MPSDNVIKKARSGARSCIECRRRKIRCVWNASRTQQTSCDACATNHRSCVPQIVDQAKPRRSGLRTRLERLESDLSKLNGTIQTRLLDEVPSTGLYVGSISEETQVPELPEHEPEHLRALFSSGSKDSSGYAAPESHSNAKAQMSWAQLIPTRAELTEIRVYASEWMSLYYTLFPASYGIRNGDQLVHTYAQIHSLDSVTASNWLLSVAITVQQMPLKSFKGMDVISYVDKVEHVIEKNLIDNLDYMKDSSDLETAMLFIRLSFGRRNFKKAWLTLRRIVSLAEAMDLPNTKEHNAKLVWQAICATDRNLGMMLNLPPGSLRYSLHKNAAGFSGQPLSPQQCNYRLADICAQVFEIDEMYSHSHEATASISYEKILMADRDLRDLLPVLPVVEGLPTLLVKFWYHYITLRVHLRPTMTQPEQFSYSQQSCLMACKGAVRLFPSFRALVPAGFFICRILDLQVFTAATVLLLVNKDDPEHKDLIHRLKQSLETILGSAGSDFAAKALGALDFLQDKNRFLGDNTRCVQIPLLGRIQLGYPTDGVVHANEELDPWSSWSFQFTIDDWTHDMDMYMGILGSDVGFTS